LIYCRDANSGLRSAMVSEVFGEVGFLTTLGVGYFAWLRLRKSNWIAFTSHS